MVPYRKGLLQSPLVMAAYAGWGAGDVNAQCHDIEKKNHHIIFFGLFIYIEYIALLNKYSISHII